MRSETCAFTVPGITVASTKEVNTSSQQYGYIVTHSLVQKSQSCEPLMRVLSNEWQRKRPVFAWHQTVTCIVVSLPLFQVGRSHLHQMIWKFNKETCKWVRLQNPGIWTWRWLSVSVANNFTLQMTNRFEFTFHGYLNGLHVNHGLSNAPSFDAGVNVR